MPHRWFPFDEITKDPEIRVFCFAHAGGNANFFREWRGTADLVEFYPVQLPGHGTRLSEPPLTRLEDIVDAFAEAAEPLLDRPFALFGHSFGAWLAYAAAQQIRTQYGQSTRHLFVSGNVPPPKTPRKTPNILTSIEEAEKYMISLGGTASGLISDKELLEILTPIFMTDINLLRIYHDKFINPLKCPITAFLG
ncbi:thioesterase II family protein, partial [Elstera litoralis]|uniref:thioesterase II family protein n=1 Tax=Elstera litoralis TaxID=552518 RepID=UPI0006976820